MKRNIVACPICQRELPTNALARHVATHTVPLRERLLVPPEDQQRIVALYRKRGATIATVAAATFWSPTTVQRVLIANDVRRRRQGGNAKPMLSVDEHLMVCELYGAGYTCREIGAQIGRAASTVNARLKRNGVVMRPRGAVVPHATGRSAAQEGQGA